MSLLLSGPTRITEWIEKAAFTSIVKGPECVEYRPKLVQVSSRAGVVVTDGDDAPCYLLIHDGHTYTAAFLSNEAASSSSSLSCITTGSIVRISDWRVSTVEHCAGRYYQKLTQAPPDTNSRAALEKLLSTPLCFSVGGKVELLGGEGMGLVGNPTDINDSIDVQRALQSFQYNQEELTKRLKLQQKTSTILLGDVTALLTGDDSKLKAVMGVPDTVQQEARIPVGDVMNVLQKSCQGSQDPWETMLSVEEKGEEIYGKQQQQGNEEPAVVEQCETEHTVTGASNGRKSLESWFEEEEADGSSKQQEQTRRSRSGSQEPIDLVGNDAMLESHDRPAKKTLETLFALAAHQQKAKTGSSSRVSRSTKPQESDNSDDSEGNGIVGVSDMLVSQQENEEDAGDCTENGKKNRLNNDTTGEEAEPFHRGCSRPPKRHKVNDFFQDFMHKARRQGYNDKGPPICLGGNHSNDAKANGTSIRTWLDANVLH